MSGTLEQRRKKINSSIAHFVKTTDSKCFGNKCQKCNSVNTIINRLMNNRKISREKYDNMMKKRKGNKAIVLAKEAAKKAAIDAEKYAFAANKAATGAAAAVEIIKRRRTAEQHPFFTDFQELTYIYQFLCFKDMLNLCGTCRIAGNPVEKTVHFKCKNFTDFKNYVRIVNRNKSFHKIKGLSVQSGHGYRPVPGNVYDFRFLNRLTLSNIVDFPEDNIKDMPELEVLELNNFKCESVSFGQLPKLRELYINKFDNLKEIKDTPEILQHLSITCCFNLERFYNMLEKNLIELRISSCCNLQKITDKFIERCMLQKLRIKKCPRFKKIADSFGNGCQLQQLSIEGCDRLSTLPPDIGFCKLLKVVSIVRCDSLEKLPESIVTCAQLETLHLNQCNSLKHIMPSIELLTCLKSITIQYCNYLKSLPTAIKESTCLETLKIVSCRRLNIGPDTFNGCNRLNKLHLSWKECWAHQTKSLIISGIQKVSVIPSMNGPEIEFRSFTPTQHTQST